MTRPSKFLLLFVLLIFVLACNVVTKPFKDVQNIAGTAESFATSMPVETLQALPSAFPVQTLESLQTSIPDLENFNYLNPQGEPVAEWKDIPIMPQATVGQEFSDSVYSFKTNATSQEIQDFYNTQLENLGWTSVFSLPIESEGGVLSFSKGDSFIAITITPYGDETVVILTLS